MPSLTPVWTYIVLTEPLTDAQFDAIGWSGREGIEDFRDLVLERDTDLTQTFFVDRRVPPMPPTRCDDR